MSSKVAIVEFNRKENIKKAYQEALKLIGGIDELNTDRSVVIKVGVFSHKMENHSSVDVVDAIISGFGNSPQIYLVESDNYEGTGTERLQIWKDLFDERIQPFNLSEDTHTKRITVSGHDIDLSHILLKPHVFVDTHVFRNYSKGSILKNLFGCTPDSKKAKYHKDTIFYDLLTKIYEEINGIDLAVLDGTNFWYREVYTPLNILIVGRDAVAVETVGSYLAGLNPQKVEVIQQFVKRGLGEGDITEIEIVGVPLESVREKCEATLKTLKEMAARAPPPWSPSKALDSLIKEGFFKLPNKRTREDIIKALEIRDTRAKDRSNVIITTLTRRVKKGVLKAEKEPGGWIYWSE